MTFTGLAAMAVSFSDVAAVDEVSGKILDAARELALAGRPRITMDQIAAGAGVSRSTVFRRFSSKEAVYDAILRRELLNMLTTTGAEVINAFTPRERAVKLIATIFAEAISNPFFRQMSNTEPSELEKLGSNPSVHTVVHNVLADALRAVQSGSPGEEFDAEVLADIVVHMTAGYVLFPTGTVNVEDRTELLRVGTRIAESLIS